MPSLISICLQTLSRVACETLTTTNRIVIAGEVRGPDSIKENVEQVARAAVKDIGYAQDGFHWQNASVEVHLHHQSVDIAQGVDAFGNKDEGAGDQGIMFGYACTETPTPCLLQFFIRIKYCTSRMPDTLTRNPVSARTRKASNLCYEDGRPTKATSVVVSTQHTEELDQDQIREIVRPHVEDALRMAGCALTKNFMLTRPVVL